MSDLPERIWARQWMDMVVPGGTWSDDQIPDGTEFIRKDLAPTVGSSPDPKVLEQALERIANPSGFFKAQDIARTALSEYRKGGRG